MIAEFLAQSSNEVLARILEELNDDAGQPLGLHNFKVVESLRCDRDGEPSRAQILEMRRRTALPLLRCRMLLVQEGYDVDRAVARAQAEDRQQRLAASGSDLI